MAKTLIKDNWTISFLWRPESSWREIHGTLPIATVRLLDNSYATLSYEATYDGSDNRVGGQFVLTDGVNTITITADAGWLFADVLKFAIVHEDGVGVTLYVETPAEGTLNESNGSMVFNDYLHFVQFSANASGEVKGLGAYGDVKFYDSNLSAADVQKIFDLDPTAPTAALTQRAGQMVFERQSAAYRIRYDRGTIDAVAESKSDTAVELVAKRPAVVVDDTITDSHVLLWTDGAKCVTAVSDSVYSTSDGENFTLEFALTDEPFATDIGGSSVVRSGYRLPDGSLLLCAESGHVWRFDGSAWSLVLTMISGYMPTFGWGANVREAEIVLSEYGAREGYPNTARRIYYSSDYGQTWSILYTHPKDSADSLHIHQAFFAPASTDTIYGVVGDGDCRHLFKLTFSGSDKTDSAEWSYTELGLNIQPTSSYLYRNQVYLGQDGTQADDSTVFILDTDTHRLRMSLALPGDTNDDKAPYATPMTGAYVWRMTEADGLLFAYAALPGSDQDGIYVHNGSSWLRLVAGACDFGVILPPDSQGRIWFTRDTTATGRAPAYIASVQSGSTRFVRARRGYTNSLSLANSCFDANIGDWYLQADATALSIGWDNTVSLFGGGSAKVVAKGLFRARLYLTLAASKNFIISAFIRFPDDLIEWYERSEKAPRASVGPFSKASANLIYVDGFATHFFENWYYMQCWVRTVAQNTSGIMVRVTPEDYPWPDEGLEFHIDGVQLIELADDDIHYSGQFQPGGTPRAAEILVASALGGGGAGGGDAGGRLFRGLL